MQTSHFVFSSSRFQLIWSTTPKDINCETLLYCQLLPCLTTPNQLWQHFQVKLTSRAEITAIELLSKIKILTVLSANFVSWFAEI